MHLPKLPVDRAFLRSALPGAALFLLALLLLGVTEHADRLRAMGEDALGGFVLTGRAAIPGPAANGRLVLAVGTPEVQAPARDAQFGVAADAPALLRKVEMFQWNETRFGGQPGYELDWFDHPIDSTVFGNSTAHANPGAFPIRAARFDSPEVRVAGFKLDAALIDMIPGADPFEPDLSRLPASMAATFSPRAGTLVTSVDGTRPQVGDLRISWKRVLPGELTVFARDRDGTLVPALDAAGNPLAQVLLGNISLANALTDAPHAPRFKWARRVLAVLLAWAGASLLMRALHRRDGVLAFAMASVPLALIAAVEWFNVRMFAFVALVLVLVFAAVAAAWRLRNGPGSA